MFGCKACKAKDTHIESLNEQIDWLRTHNGTPSLTAQNKQARQGSDVLPWMSEEEEELAAMQQAGLIDVEGAKQALEQIGALNTDIFVEE